MDEYMKKSSIKEILQRIKVIDDERDSAFIVDRIRQIGHPVGVDMEGHHGSTVGLVQVKSSDGAIYLFRTGANPKILLEGKLKTLLEDSAILKVFHAGVGDAIVIYKCGVKMVNLYDTAIAHLVIEYQNRGRSIHTSRGKLLNFNKICERYGLPMNPMKTDMKKSSMLWMREEVYQQPKLPDEMIAYAAYDVEPLLDLQLITSSLLEEDYLPLLRELCEEDIIRNVDPELLKLKKASLKEQEEYTVFLHGLKSQTGKHGINKAELYEVLARHEGLKKVQSSKSSAHVILPSRQSAILLYQSLTKNDSKLGNLAKPFIDIFGTKAKAALIHEAEPSEIMAANIDTTEALNRMKSENYIMENQTIKKLSSILVKTNLAVILDFVGKGEDLSLELFTGTHPTLKFKLSSETVQCGLGEIFASSQIVKVVPRLDTDNVHQALRIAASNGFKPMNFFDLNSACNAIDYVVIGQSMFMAPTLPSKMYSSRLGIETPTKMDDYLYTYLYLINRLLPQSILRFLSTKSSIETDIGSNVSLPESKEKRRKLRLEHEGQCVHVCIKNEMFVDKIKTNGLCPSTVITSILSSILEEHNLTYTRIDAFKVGQIVSREGGVAAVVQLPYPDDILKFINAVNTFEASNVENVSIFKTHKQSTAAFHQDFRPYLKDLAMEASKITLKEPSRVDSQLLRKANLSDLDNLNRPCLQKLDDLGFFDVLNEYKT